MKMLTTKQCAEVLDAAYDSPGGYSAAFVLFEIDAGRLHARVHDQRKSRRRIRVHPDDFVCYLSKHYASILERAKQHPFLAA